MKMTKKVYDGQEYFEAQIQTKLVQISEQKSENVNGKAFYPCTVEYEGREFGAIIYESNYNYGMSVGKTYLTTVRQISGDNRGPLVTVSHLTNAPRATLADLGLELPAEVEASESVKREQEEAATVVETADDDKAF